MLDLDLELCFMRQVFSGHFIPINNVRARLKVFFYYGSGNNVNGGGDGDDDDDDDGDDIIIIMIVIMTKDHFHLPWRSLNMLLRLM